jgi:hypothetical protein
MATVLRTAPGALDRVKNATCFVIGAREGDWLQRQSTTEGSSLSLAGAGGQTGRRGWWGWWGCNYLALLGVGSISIAPGVKGQSFRTLGMAPPERPDQEFAIRHILDTRLTQGRENRGSLWAL